MKKIISFSLVLVFSICMLTACGSSGPDLTEVTNKYNEAADIFNEATKLVNANGWKDVAESLKQHNELADAIDGIKVIIEDPEQAKDIDVDAMSKNLDSLISALKEYKAAVSVPFPTESTPAPTSDVDTTTKDVAEEGYATDAQKKEMVDALVQMFNGVNTDFNGMVELLNEKGLIVEGTKLTEDLRKFSVVLQEVHDGLTGETITSADVEDFMDKIEATDKFIGETIEAYLKD